MVKRKIIPIVLVLSLMLGCFAGCSSENANTDTSSDMPNVSNPKDETDENADAENGTDDQTERNTMYTDKNGDIAYIPKGFTVSTNEDEQTISTGLVVIGPDGSEFVWIPTTQTLLKVRDFGSYVLRGSSFEDYYDETELERYQ